VVQLINDVSFLHDFAREHDKLNDFKHHRSAAPLSLQAYAGVGFVENDGLSYTGFRPTQEPRNAIGPACMAYFCMTSATQQLLNAPPRVLTTESSLLKTVISRLAEPFWELLGFHTPGFCPGSDPIFLCSEETWAVREGAKLEDTLRPYTCEGRQTQLTND